MRATSEIGFVYFFRQGEFTKIGRSRDPAKRLASFQSLPYPVDFWHQFPSQDSAAVERTLHRRFQSARVRGEWFRLTSHELDCVRLVAAADSPQDLPVELLPPPDKRLAARSLAGKQINLRVPDHLAEEMASVADGIGLNVASLIRLMLAERLWIYQQRVDQVRSASRN